MTALMDLAGLTAAELADWYQPRSGMFRSNMVVSLDGSVTDRADSSRGLSGATDLLVLRVLRAISDVVVVGGATARQEGYVPGRLHPDVETLASRPPRLAVVSRSLDFEAAGPLFSGITRPIILTEERALRCLDVDAAAWVRQAGDIRATERLMTGAWVRSTLEGMGLGTAVIEGGPAIQGLMRADDAIDEIDMTLAPCVVGSPTAAAAFGTREQMLSPIACGQAGDHVFLRLACLH